MKVLVGLSGGVDSSVAAALLREAGHDVTAFTLLLGQADPDGTHRCCAPSDIRDARLVAERLGMGHYVWDYKEFFKEKVMHPFLSGYESGITPNPCGMCNRSVRFGAVLDRALRLGFDALATGHYARAENGALYRALDRQKDQAYFLSRIRAESFSHLLFPLAHLTKSRVRSIAADMRLPTHAKPESQEICFVSGKTSDFLSREIPARPGNIVDPSGRILGRHDGVHFFTLGQRKGLGVSGPEPLYVTAIDAARNCVTVGPKSEAFRDRVRLRECNYLSGWPPPSSVLPSASARAAADRLQGGGGFTAELRYHAKPAGVESASADESGLELKLAEPVFAPAPGQIAVLYDGDRVVASGLIAA